MQRELDLLRQLLLDIERRGAATPIDTLRIDTRPDTDEKVRYHLRLLVDAGLLKEAGRTSAGAPCVRLTHEGHEFLELTRSDARWCNSKAVLKATTGGVPLTLLKADMARRAWRTVIQHERHRLLGNRRHVRRYVEHLEPENCLGDCMADPNLALDDDQARFTGARAVRRAPDLEAGWDPVLDSDAASERWDALIDATLPEHLL